MINSVVISSYLSKTLRSLGRVPQIATVALRTQSMVVASSFDTTRSVVAVCKFTILARHRLLRVSVPPRYITIRLTAILQGAVVFLQSAYGAAGGLFMATTSAQDSGFRRIHKSIGRR